MEGVTDFREAVERGARERLVPILMTAMAAGLALIPLALGGGKSGSEIQTPMAIVILCGLMTSTLLNMVVVPTLYLRFGRPAAARRSRFRRRLSTRLPPSMLSDSTTPRRAPAPFARVQPALALAAGSPDGDLRLVVLAAHARLSAFHLHRVLSAVTGETPSLHALGRQSATGRRSC